jgi:hypothetical protein
MDCFYIKEPSCTFQVLGLVGEVSRSQYSAKRYVVRIKDIQDQTVKMLSCGKVLYGEILAALIEPPILKTRWQRFSEFVWYVLLHRSRPAAQPVCLRVTKDGIAGNDKVEKITLDNCKILEYTHI